MTDENSKSFVYSILVPNSEIHSGVHLYTVYCTVKAVCVCVCVNYVKRTL